MDDLWLRFALAVLFSSAIAVRALSRKSVDLSGVAAGIPVMVIHTVAGYRFAVLLLVFFFTSSKLTRIGEEKKREADADFKEGGQRNWRQVLANSGIASILLVMLARLASGQDRCLDTNDSKIITSLLGGIIGHYACCNGDTWSSELGILSISQPRLITTFKDSSLDWLNYSRCLYIAAHQLSASNVVLGKLKTCDSWPSSRLAPVVLLYESNLMPWLQET